MSPEDISCGICDGVVITPRRVTCFRMLSDDLLQPLCSVCQSRYVPDPAVLISMDEGIDQYRCQEIHES